MSRKLPLSMREQKNAWTIDVKTGFSIDRLSYSPKTSQMEIGGTSEVEDMI